MDSWHVALLLFLHNLAIRQEVTQQPQGGEEDNLSLLVIDGPPIKQFQSLKHDRNITTTNYGTARPTRYADARTPSVAMFSFLLSRISAADFSWPHNLAWNNLIYLFLLSLTYILWSKWTSSVQRQPRSKTVSTAKLRDSTWRNVDDFTSRTRHTAFGKRDGDTSNATSGQERKRRHHCDDDLTLVAKNRGRKFSRTYYTVGWICAISTEHVAAQAFLDEEHEGPEDIPDSDDNDYTLGRVGKHNVVIAVLPVGEYGISSAASVAKDLSRSFPNVRIGLMVGIGGGAPSRRHDIRLGDIVVSAPGDGEGGVFQYDFGKTIQGEAFHITGFLNQPPTFLRTAVNGLKTQYKSKGHHIEEAINSILQRNPRLQDFKRPHSSMDNLYRPEIRHPQSNEQSCLMCCGNDPKKLVSRRDRTEHEDKPAIHYGLIASANQVLKDALIRDKLTAQKDILCFEMEAAGLMNQFPCLIIRGICDYADSHKNKEWQGYAAMAAAAYAKDLLSRIAPSKVEAEKKLSDVIACIEQSMNEVRMSTQATITAVKKMGNDHRQGKIERWLSPPHPSVNYQKALQQRCKDSGIWFINSDEFLIWKTRRNSFIWLHGIAGCGKTILSSSIIEHLDASLSSRSLLYFYFDFNDASKQTLENMVRSLISQLYFKREDARHLLDSLFASCDDGRRQPTFDSICKLLLQILDQIREVWVVLDALDECRTRTGPSTKGVLSWIRELLSSDRRTVHLLVTSRQEHDILAEFEKWAGSETKVPIQSELVNKDIRAYVHKRVREDSDLERWKSRPDVQDEIEMTLTEKADGMFRWAACQLDALVECYDYDDLQHALARLPDTLDETYFRILNSISSKHKQKAIKVLQFLAFSERPMHINEVVDALVVNTTGRPYFDQRHRMPNPREVSRYCKSLVVVVSRDDSKCASAEENQPGDLVLQLAHFSVKEYLTSERVHHDFTDVFEEAAARASIAITCTAYLSYLGQEMQLQDHRTRFPFANYCAQYWLGHASAASKIGLADALHSFIMEFFANKRAFRLWFHLHYQGMSAEPASPLYYASLAGLKREVRALIAMGKDVNASGGVYGNVLKAASIGGNEHIVKLLLDNGANVNTPGGGHGTALTAASGRGHKHIVKMLLDSGAEVNARDNGYTALTAASAQGNEHIVKLLLDSGAVVNAGKSALIAASSQGNEDVVKLLLDRGADVNAKDLYNTPLTAASDQGSERIVKLLLDSGADVNASKSALIAASSQGNEHVVKLLLDRGADVNAKDLYNTPLIAASGQGNEHIVNLLLDSGADVNASGNYGQMVYTECTIISTALTAASTIGNEHIVKLLLNRGANVNAGDERDKSALIAASSKGNEHIVKLLLDHGANVNARDMFGHNALVVASGSGHQQIVKLLLERGADAKREGGKAITAASGGGHEHIVKLLYEKDAFFPTLAEYGTALMAASSRGEMQTVNLLLESGVDVRRGGCKAITAASCGGHEHIVKLLFEKGAFFCTLAEYGTALTAASGGGHGRIVKLLLERGIDFCTSAEYGTALTAAAIGGHEHIVKLLLNSGADVNERGEIHDVSALTVASARGDVRIVNLLLESGANVNAKGRFWSISTETYGTALTAASDIGNDHIVKLLLANGASPNPQDEKSDCALTAASARGNDRIVKLLLDSGADINATGSYKNSDVWGIGGSRVKCGARGNALQAASARGNRQIVKLLLDSGAEVNARCEGDNGNALTAASARGDVRIVNLLLESGAEVKNGNALAAASDGGHKHIVNLLLGRGADIRERARGGLTCAGCKRRQCDYVWTSGGNDTMEMALLSHHSVDRDRED